MYIIAGGQHAKNDATDMTITSSLSKSASLHSTKSFDHAIRLVENPKFKKDLHKVEPFNHPQPNASSSRL
jgi:hypothetical protein